MKIRPVRPSTGLTAAALLAAAALVLPFAARPASGAGGLSDLIKGPLIRLDARRWDFGEISQDAKVEHEFRVRNEGTEPLRLTKVESDCGCTVGVLQDSVLTPGSGTVLKVTLDPGAFEGDLQKVIALYTNDPAEPRIDLVLRAMVRPFVSVEKNTLDFGPVRRGETPWAATRLTAEDGTDFRITSVVGGDERVQWSYEREGTGKWVVTARLKGTAPLGIFMDRCEVRLEHPRIKLVRVFTKGNIFSYFRPEESKLTFDPTPVRRTHTKTLRIEAPGDRPYRILSATSSTPYLTTDLQPQGKGYLLSVTLKAPNRAVKFKEEIILATSDPAQPEIKIETRGIVVE